jgi:hypothetical protein
MSKPGLPGTFPWVLLFVLVMSAPAREAAAHAAGDDSGFSIEAMYARQVDMRLDVPPAEQSAYGERLGNALSVAGIREIQPQYFLLVDRSPMVQAVFVFWHSPGGEWHSIGASPVSTGFAGGFEYFITPLGVFEHSPANMDFRAEGTRNVNGIRGYGVRGMRIFDFGWVEAERTWGSRGRSLMRLQVHATDPDRLENQLGRARSKGCIRIPASLNVFIDRYGLLDAEYERAVGEGRRLWVLRPDREPVARPGKYLVIVDSGRKIRPSWSPWPPRRERTPAKRQAADSGSAPRIERHWQEYPDPGNGNARSGQSTFC